MCFLGGLAFSFPVDSRSGLDVWYRSLAFGGCVQSISSSVGTIGKPVTSPGSNTIGSNSMLSSSESYTHTCDVAARQYRRHSQTGVGGGVKYKITRGKFVSCWYYSHRRLIRLLRGKIRQKKKQKEEEGEENTKYMLFLH